LAGAHRDEAGHSIPRRINHQHLGNDTAAPWHACGTAGRASSRKSRRSLGARRSRPDYQDSARS
jgi:hypothetical protein